MKSLVLTLAVFFSLSAQAYTPPNGFILNQMLKNRESLKELSFEGKITDVKRNAVFKESVYINFLTGKVTLTYLSADDGAVGSVQTTLSAIHRLGKFWLGIALDPNGVRFKKDLEELNALPPNLSVASLNRIGNKVTWSWGDESLIQFYKDEFLAADYQFGVADSLEEIDLKDYTQYGAAIRIPKVVAVRQKGQDLFTFELKSMKVNTPIKELPEVAPVNSVSAQEWMALVR